MIRKNSLATDFVSFARERYGLEGSIPLHAPRFTKDDKRYVSDAIDSTYVSSVGQFVDEFEEEIARFTGARYVVATNTGTSALHVALLVAGVLENDEVITPTLTFVATCNAVKYCGGFPVFVDVERETLGLSPIALGEFLSTTAEVLENGLCRNRQTGRVIRMCLPVNNLGHPARIKEINNICAEYNIGVIEDAAESLGSFAGGKHSGLGGIAGVLSFNGNKIITTGGGGAIITNHKYIAAQAKHLSTTAKKAHAWEFEHDDVGFNYRMPNINAALGCAQMLKIEEYLQSKRRLAQQYEEWFAARGVEFVSEPSDCRSNYWLNACLFESKEERDDFLQITNTSNVQTRPLWKPMHSLPMFQNCSGDELKVSKDVASRLACLPSSPSAI